MNFWTISLPFSLITLPLYIICEDTNGVDCLYNSVYDTQTAAMYCIGLYSIYSLLKRGANLLFKLVTRSRLPIANAHAPEVSAQDTVILASRSDRSTPIEQENSLEIEEIPYAAKLIQSIAYIEGWLNSKNLLAVTTPYNFKDTTRAYNTETARKYVIELLSIDRAGRLATILNHIYFEVARSKELVESLAILIMWSFGIPEERGVTEFQNIESLLVDALSTPRDSFIFDFVVCTLLGRGLDKETLLKEMANAERSPFIDTLFPTMGSEVIEKFMKSSFMTKEIRISRPSLFVRSLKKVRSAILSVFMGCDRKYKRMEAFDELTNLIIKELNMLHLHIRVLDGKSHVPTPPPSPISNDSSLMPPYVNESPLKVTADYGTMIKSGTGEHVATFKNDILPRRINRDDIRSRLVELMSKDNLKLFIKKRKNPDAYYRLKRIQRSFGNLVYNLSEYETYLYEYEKRFVLSRAFDICDLFRLELFNLKARNSTQEIGKLNVQAVNTVWCLDHVYKKFLEFDNSYSRDGYLHRIKLLHQTLLSASDIQATNDNP